MDIFNSRYNRSIAYIKKDWQHHPWRLLGECYNWFVSVLVAIVFAVTVPSPPLIWLYPTWISGLLVAILCAKSRGSFGVLMGASSMALIDTLGYIHLLLS